jgi:nucleotide-binding universal stress UspA family protein
MKKILLPTDFSENAWNALIYALQLYKNETCNFVLLNTYTPIIYQVEHLQASTHQLRVMEAVKETSKKQLDALLKKIESKFSNSNHKFTTISAFNTLPAEIDHLYEGGVMDLIIMGTKGASGLKEVLLGSNTVQVLNHAKCPIIAIPSNFEYEKPHDILFPTDYEISYKKKHLKPLIDIATTHHARLNVMHVFNEKTLTDKQKTNRATLESKLKKTGPLFHDIKSQNIPEAIAQFQLKTPINLLVMINNKRSFFENLFFKPTINQIGFHLHIPFLVIPPKV